jgi:hypothetical protein
MKKTIAKKDKRFLNLRKNTRMPDKPRNTAWESLKNTSRKQKPKPAKRTLKFPDYINLPKKAGL